jgi:hypothetical protein
MSLEGEMPGVQEMRLDIGKIPFVRGCALRWENVVVLSPDDQRWRLILTEELLELRIERNVGSVVVEHVQLDVAIAGTVH